MKEGYEETVCTFVKNNLHHNFNVGGAFNDTYISRLSSRHRFLYQVSQKEFAVQEEYFTNAEELARYTRSKIEEHLNSKLRNLTILKNLIGNRQIEPNDADIRNERDFLDGVLSDNNGRRFVKFLEAGFDKKADGFLSMSYGFEICMFSILKIFLAKFGCKLYRDSRTYSVDKGGDISTNFGVVYQIKNYCLTNEEKFSELLNELFLNFSDGRIQQGNVFLIVKEASDGIMAQLKKQSIGCITKKSVTDLLDKLTSEEKREVLISTINEFNRELVSDVCRLCRKPGKTVCPFSVGVEIQRAKATNTTTNLNAFL